MDEKTDREYSSEFKNAVYCILDNFKTGKMTSYEAEEEIEKYLELIEDADASESEMKENLEELSKMITSLQKYLRNKNNL